MKDAWEKLRQWTPARIALGRAGGSLPTAAVLNFRLAHARAVDAVHQPFDSPEFARQLGHPELGCQCLTTAVRDRVEYLRRPDLGRCLSEQSLSQLQHWAGPAPRCDLVICLSNGLSALALQRQGPPVLAALLPLLAGWNLAPLMIVSHARVAMQDQIGAVVGAKIALMLIGERPGLIAPDSLGAYLVYGPKPGNTDAHRNCISNIRPEGFDPARAAASIHYLLTQSQQRKISGVLLKDESSPPAVGGIINCGDPPTDDPCLMNPAN